MLKAIIRFFTNEGYLTDREPPKFIYTREEREKIAESAPRLAICVFDDRNNHYQRTAALWEYFPDGSRKLGKKYIDNAQCFGPACCLRDWIEKQPQLMAAIKHLNSYRFFGLVFIDGVTRKVHAYYQPGDIVHLDGNCGFDCMEKILAATGFKVVLVREYACTSYYELRSL